MDIKKHYDSIEKFNDIAGNLSSVDSNALDKQLSYVFEELQEAITAFEEKRPIDFIDGVCDLFVTVAGLMQQCEAMGVDLEEALRLVCDNNLSKFKTVAYDIGVPDGWYWERNLEYKLNVLKDKEGKVRKPFGFVPVDLSVVKIPKLFQGVA